MNQWLGVEANGRRWRTLDRKVYITDESHDSVLWNWYQIRRVIPSLDLFFQLLRIFFGPFRVDHVGEWAATMST
jgi:hypothetical protein